MIALVLGVVVDVVEVGGVRRMVVNFDGEGDVLNYSDVADYSYCTAVEFRGTGGIIAEETFSEFALETALVDGDAVAIVSRRAFRNCVFLESFTARSGLEYVGGYAFVGCSSLRKIDLGRGEVTLEEWAFRDLKKLEELVLPAELRKVGRGCFEQTGLRRVESEAGAEVDVIGLFSGCGELDTVSIGSWRGGQQIPEGMFYGCVKLRLLTLPRDAVGVAKSAFVGCGALEFVTFGSSSVSIFSDAFAGLDRLRLVVGSLRELERSAFDGCRSLESIDLKDVTEIGQAALRGCSALRNVSLGPWLNALGPGAFDFCSSLETIHVYPAEIRATGPAFRNCTAVRKIWYYANVAVGPGICVALGDVMSNPGLSVFGSVVEFCGLAAHPNEPEGPVNFPVLAVVLAACSLALVCAAVGGGFACWRRSQFAPYEAHIITQSMIADEDE